VQPFPDMRQPHPSACAGRARHREAAFDGIEPAKPLGIARMHPKSAATRMTLAQSL